MQDTLINISDTLTTAKDTLANSADTPLNHLTFDISRAFEGNSIYISVVGYVVVFVALLLLAIILMNLSKLLSLNIKKKLAREKGESKEEKDPFDIPGEVTAAIAMALHLHFEEAHDLENTILTIKKVQRPYSPWSSKIYSLREFPNKLRR